MVPTWLLNFTIGVAVAGSGVSVGRVIGRAVGDGVAVGGGVLVGRIDVGDGVADGGGDGVGVTGARVAIGVLESCIAAGGVAEV